MRLTGVRAGTSVQDPNMLLRCGLHLSIWCSDDDVSCREATYHKCSYPVSDSSIDNTHCCMTGTCVASAVSVIPDSEKSWWCGASPYVCRLCEQYCVMGLVSPAHTKLSNV